MDCRRSISLTTSLPTFHLGKAFALSWILLALSSPGVIEKLVMVHLVCLVLPSGTSYRLPYGLLSQLNLSKRVLKHIFSNVFCCCYFCVYVCKAQCSYFWYCAILSAVVMLCYVIDFEILAKKVLKFFCFLLFSAIDKLI